MPKLLFLVKCSVLQNYKVVSGRKLQGNYSWSIKIRRRVLTPQLIRSPLTVPLPGKAVAEPGLHLVQIEIDHRGDVEGQELGEDQATHHRQPLNPHSVDRLLCIHIPTHLP